MDNAKNSKKYSIIAAICYALLFIIYVTNIIRWMVGNMAPALVVVISTLVYIVLAIGVFTENTTAVAAALGIYTLVRTYYLIASFDFSDFLMLIAYATVFVIMAIQKKETINKIWFIGGAVMFLSMIVHLIELAEADYFKDIGYCIEYGDFARLWMLCESFIFVYVFEVVGLLFIGLWLRESEFPSTTTSVTANNCNAVNANSSNAVNAAPVAAPIDFGAVSGADRLKMYKDLLDYGAITQEEFDAKKKEILEK